MFAFVMPEYNYAFSAPLKNAIDFLYHEWRYKPVGFGSYGGMSGGLRAVQMMKQVVTTLRMVPTGEAVTIFTRRQLDADGRLIVDDDLSASATRMLDELGRLTQAMSTMRTSGLGRARRPPLWARAAPHRASPWPPTCLPRRDPRGRIRQRGVA